MRTIIFLAALLLAGVIGLTLLVTFTTLTTVLQIVLVVIYAFFIIIALSLAAAEITHRCRRDC